MIRHQYPATSLCLGTDTIIAGGSDMKLFVYEKETGKVKQKFDYSKDSPDVDMSCAVISSAGQSIVVGCVSKLKIYHYNNRKKSWEEGKEKNLGESFYPTWMQWRKDGTYLAVATSFGAFHLLEAVYKYFTTAE
jgi:WD40 repeat protein